MLVLLETDDKLIMAGLDRMEIFFFHYSNCFINKILTAPMTWHTLNSFLPIFELLGPKFVLDQNVYVSSYYYLQVSTPVMLILTHVPSTYMD